RTRSFSPLSLHDALPILRVARELILKENVDFLVGTLTSAEGPAVSVVAKENKIVFIAPIPKTDQLTAADKLHPYVFRVAATTTIDRKSTRLNSSHEWISY